MYRSTHALLLLLLAGTVPLPAAAATIVPDSPTTAWTDVRYFGSDPDYHDDQQTGVGERDIVGDADHAALYTIFDDAGTPSLTDGNLGFRVRIGDDSGKFGFHSFLAIGFDVDLDGALDLFLGVANAGSGDHIEIYGVGTDLNNSPSTTSLVSTGTTYPLTAANYDFSPVDSVIDPDATSFDIDGGGTDHFISFVVPFQDIVDALSTDFPTFDENTSVQYVFATAAQDNSLNGDLGGPQGGVGSSTSWMALGATSMPYSINGLLSPEPGSGALLAFGLVALGVVRRRRR